MGRAPCCDKVGLKRGPWTPEEDKILISFIQQHGHSNWRALPRQAGLLRCGKSCRLRWINYLKPDIKRGNFSKEEEDTIIQLHEMMGNRWSAIAASLPGRTDNEIKNVWHTHLKKRLEQYQTKKSQGKKLGAKKHCDATNAVTTSNSTISTNSFPETSAGTTDHAPNSSQQSYTSDDFSSLTEVSSVEAPNNMPGYVDAHSMDDFAIIDETFWSAEEFSYDDINMSSMFPNMVEDNQMQVITSHPEEDSSGALSNVASICSEQAQLNHHGDSLDFWLDVFVRAGGAPELPEF